MLRPSGRTAAGYRRYSPTDEARLARLCRYRQAGLSLAAIRDLLDTPESDLDAVLSARLDQLNDEIRHLGAQRRYIVEVLTRQRGKPATAPLTLDRIVEVFEVAGISADQRRQWHASFERLAAPEHQALLEFLCLPEETIGRIRRDSGGPADPSPGGKVTPGRAEPPPGRPGAPG